MKWCIFGSCMLLAAPAVAAPPFLMDEAAVQAAADRLDAAFSKIWEQQRQEYSYWDLPPLPGQAAPAAFLRRASMDLAGRPPSADEVRDYLADVAQDKADRLVDRLLASESAQRHQLYHWAEALRLQSPAHQSRPPAWAAWFRDQIRQDTPWHELAVALVQDRARHGRPAHGILGGDTPDLARTASDFAAVFLGADLHCARCHDHPFNNYTQSQALSLAACLAGPEDPPVIAPKRYLYADMKPGEPVKPKFLPLGKTFTGKSGNTPEHGPAADRPMPDQLAAWLMGAARPRLAEAGALRLWLRLFGPATRQGLWREGTQDMQPVAEIFSREGCDASPGAWQALRAFERMEDTGSSREAIRLLGQEFARTGLREREFLRVLARTQAYRRAALELKIQGMPLLPQAPPLRRALPQFTWQTMALMKEGAVKVWEVPANGHPLLLLGQGKRQWPDESLPAISHQMAAFFMSGEDVQTAASQIAARLAREPAAVKIEEAFLATLGRYPEKREKDSALAHLLAEPEAGMQDITWALLNTAEFLFVP